MILFIVYPISKKSINSLVKFDFIQNELTIPKNYYDLIVVGYRYDIKEIGDKPTITKKYNKFCLTYFDQIYCSCSSKNDFRVITLYIKNNSRMDVELRDYVYYDKSSFYLKYRVDVSLLKDEEFVVGLRGLNNIILSFDLEDDKIEFFHIKKEDNYGSSLLWIIILIFLLFLYYFIK